MVVYLFRDTSIPQASHLNDKITNFIAIDVVTVQLQWRVQWTGDMRGESEGTKLVCSGEGEFWDNLTAVWYQLRRGYRKDFFLSKRTRSNGHRQSQVAEDNHKWAKMKKKNGTARLFTHRDSFPREDAKLPSMEISFYVCIGRQTTLQTPALGFTKACVEHTQPHRSLQPGIWPQGMCKTCQESTFTPPTLHGMNLAEAMAPKALLSLDKSAASFTYETWEKMLEKR